MSSINKKGPVVWLSVVATVIGAVIALRSAGLFVFPHEAQTKAETKEQHDELVESFGKVIEKLETKSHSEAMRELIKIRMEGIEKMQDKQTTVLEKIDRRMWSINKALEPER